MELRPQDWFQTIRQEYFQRFVGQGGSSVKFVVTPSDTDRTQVQDQLIALAQKEDYACVRVDAKDTKIHMMDKFFHQVARRIEWDALASQFVRRLLQENGYQIPEGQENFSLAGVARMNERAEPLLRRDLNSWLERAIYRDTHMCQEFRMAMIRLCLGQMDSGSESPFMTEPVKAWLCGELRQISALKEALIFQKIVRTNARYMFASLSRWLRLVGKTGLVVSLDLSRCLESKKPTSPEGLYYGVSATLDAYEMLRQFIDGTDELESLLLVVSVPPEFLTDTRRGLNRYEALKLRIWDEVRDRKYQNPLGALIRLSASGNSREDTEGNAESYEQAAMANGDVSHQRAMEALRSGVPNRDVVKVLGSHQPDLEGKFRRLLQQMSTQAPQGIPTKGLVIEGGFGSGKSHLLKALQHVALELNFVCSPIVISKETPFYNIATLLRSAINDALVPGKQGDALTEVAGDLNFQSPQYSELYDWVHRKEQGCDSRFAATLYLYERMINDPELSHRMIRFWAGDPLSNGQLKKYLQGCAPEIPYAFDKLSPQDLAWHRFQFVSRLMMAAGYKGWILLIDEAEIIGRYSFKQRTKSYVEVARWLGALEDKVCPGISAIVALTDDFQSVVLDEKQDTHKIEQLCQEADGGDGSHLAHDALRGIRLIEQESESLIRPYDPMVDTLYEQLRGLHGSAYSWNPPPVSAVEKLSSTRMREYVRGWITEWDLRRLYPEAQLDIEIVDVRQNYEEDQELESAEVDEADVLITTEAEDAMLAVASQNQATV
ncbi:MAG: BREX system ATP-binding domain-containing protein [Nitrospirales bacterium]